MKKTPSITTALRLAALLAVSYSATNLLAVPYASSLTNDGSSISFRLNEAADSVKIVSGAGFATTNDLGARPAGLNTANVSITGPYKIIAAKSGTNAITQIGATIAVNSPRGIAVNNNPASPYFGRVYMANSAAGTLGDGIYVYNADLSNPYGSSTNLRTAGYNFGTGGVSAPMRISVGLSDELYISDWSDPAGNLIVTDPDVTSFQYVLKPLEGTAALPLVVDGVRTNNHGSIYAAHATGSLATGDLKVYTMDEDYQQDPTRDMAQWNSIWVYDIGAGPLPWDKPPDRLLCTPSIQFLSQNGDFTLGPSGMIYVNQRRANATILTVGGGTYTPSLFVVDPNIYIDPTNYNGTGFFLTTNSAEPDSYFTNFYAMYDPTNLPNVAVPGITNFEGVPLFTRASNYNRHIGSGGHIWDSQSASSDIQAGFADLFGEANGVSVSPDGKFIATITWGGLNGLNANEVKIARLTNGIPDLTKFFTFPTASATAAGRGIAWDRANNLYILSSGGAYMKAYSLGLNATTITGSDGTFELVLPPNEVWVSATDRLATEGTPASDTGTFTFHRSGDTSEALTVNYAISGTAANTTDYQTIGTSVTFAPGASTTNVVIIPVDDDIAEVPETVILTIAGSPNYTSLYGRTATVLILDNETPQISITALFTNMYERVSGQPTGNDFTRFQLVRRGDTNSPAFVNIEYGGVNFGVDLTGSTGEFLNPGEVTRNFDVNPLDNSEVTGTRAFTVSVAPSGSGEYTVGSPSSATGYIIDDDLPAENVIWSENFDSFAGLNPNQLPPNWTFTFGATNNLPDYTFNFAFDYAALLIPPAPNSGFTTMGLFATVNKGDANAFAAGLNLYPANVPPFTNDYALRFNMMLLVPSFSNQTEHAIFGINHAGDKTNWNYSGASVLNGNNQDGLWFGINNSGGNLFDNVLFTRGTSATAPLVLSNRPATTLTQTFKNPPYFGAGMPGINQATVPLPTYTWLDVEVAQTTNMVVLRLNETVIIQTTNITPFKSGTIMLGYNDMFNSIGGPNGAVLYDNARVVTISTPTITAQPVGGSAFAGGTVNLSVTASTTTGVTTYQWFRNGVPIAGATGSTYTITDLQAASAGTYTVLVSDGRYPVMSQPAVVSLAVAPVLAISLNGTTVNVTFNSAAGANYTLLYKNDLSDATWSTLQTVPGTGSPITVPDNNPFAATGTRYYLLQVQ